MIEPKELHYHASSAHNSDDTAACVNRLPHRQGSSWRPCPAALRKTGEPYGAGEVKHALGLDVPIYVQYYNYVVGLFQGNLGIAFSNEQPVAPQVLSAFPATLELSICSMFVAVVVGVVLGVTSSRKYGSRGGHNNQNLRGCNLFDSCLLPGPDSHRGIRHRLHILPSGERISALIPTGGTFFGVHIQTGLYTVDSLLAGNLGEFVDAVRHLILPSLALGLYISAVFLRITRSNMLEALSQEYVTAAKARGLKERTVLYGYGLETASSQS